MSVLDLVTALQRARWGALAAPAWRCHRHLLTVLGDLLWDQHAGRRGTLVITARQLADAVCYSERWVRSALHELEELGIVEWHRGGVIEGRPQPGILRVVKRRLCDLIEEARAAHEKRLARRREVTRARLAGLRLLRIPPFRRRGAAHAEVNATLPPSGGGGAARRSGAPSAPPPRKDIAMSDDRQLFAVPDDWTPSRILQEGERAKRRRRRAANATPAAKPKPKPQAPVEFEIASIGTWAREMSVHDGRDDREPDIPAHLAHLSGPALARAMLAETLAKTSARTVSA